MMEYLDPSNLNSLAIIAPVNEKQRGSSAYTLAG